MLIKNRDKIAEIGHLIPPVLNMYGVSADQNEVVLRKIYGLQLKKMRLMRGLTQMKVANAISVTFQQIQKYEKGTNAITTLRLEPLRIALDIPAHRVGYIVNKYNPKQRNIT